MGAFALGIGFLPFFQIQQIQYQNLEAFPWLPSLSPQYYADKFQWLQAIFGAKFPKWFLPTFNSSTIYPLGVEPNTET
jgi:hypothetical protein